MATFDREQQKIVLRIVYDGPARAGKTTNVQQLCGFFTLRRRSELFIPEEMAGRTLFFDWMHLDGGLVAGHQLRCQIVTVPGQRRLASRRKHILQTADVVVYVCSSAAGSQERSRSMLDTLRWSLRSVGRSDVPIIVQANKQDLKTALGVDQLREALELEPETEVLAACARDAVGVRETAVLAIRAGAARVAKILMEQGLDAIEGRLDGAEELLAQLKEVDDGALRSADTVDELFELDDDEDEEADESEGAHDGTLEGEGASATGQHPERQGEGAGEGPRDGDGEAQQRAAEREPEAGSAQAASARNAEAGTPARPQPLETPRPDARQAPAPPRPSERVASGCVWPSATGRQVLRTVGRERWTRRWDLVGQRGIHDGSGTADAVIYQAGTWCAKTSPRRRYDNVDDGRAALLQMARSKIRLGQLLPPRTVLSLQEDPQGTSWIWTVAPWMRTLRTEMREAEQQEGDDGLARALGKYARAVAQSARMAATTGVLLDVHPSNFAAVDRQIFYLDDDIDAGEQLPGLGHAVLQRVEEYAERTLAVETYIAEVQRELKELVSPLQLRELHAVEAFEQAITRHPMATRAQHEITDTLARHARAKG